MHRQITFREIIQLLNVVFTSPVITACNEIKLLTNLTSALTASHWRANIWVVKALASEPEGVPG